MTAVTESATHLPKADPAPKPRRRRESISVAPLPRQNASLGSASSQPNSAVYMSASAPPTTSNLFSFGYPSPSSTSPSSTCADSLDCYMNTNYVNPADLFSVGPYTTPQNFATPASASSFVPPTPPFTTYMSSFPCSTKHFSTTPRASIDSSVFDYSSMMATLSDSSSVSTIDDSKMMLDTNEVEYSPHLLDITSTASFTADSGFNSAHSNTPFQFSWQPDARSHGTDEYNTGLPLDASPHSISRMDIFMKQGSKLNGTPVSPDCVHNAQLFAAFPDSNDVFDLLIDDKDSSQYTRKEIVDSMLRGNLIATTQSAGISVPEIPVAVDLSIYVSAFWEHIHPHCPIFFKPGFVAQFVQEGILLGMCALGALTMGAIQHALSLQTCAKAVARDVSRLSRIH